MSLRRTFRIYRQHHVGSPTQAIGEAPTYEKASGKIYMKFFPADEKRMEITSTSPGGFSFKYIYSIQEEFTAQEPMEDLY